MIALIILSWNSIRLLVILTGIAPHQSISIVPENLGQFISVILCVQNSPGNYLCNDGETRLLTHCPHLLEAYPWGPSLSTDLSQDHLKWWNSFELGFEHFIFLETPWFLDKCVHSLLSILWVEHTEIIGVWGTLSSHKHNLHCNNTLLHCYLALAWYDSSLTLNPKIKWFHSIKGIIRNWNSLKHIHVMWTSQTQNS